MSVRVDFDAGKIVAHRTIRKSGRSHVISIPPEILDAADFEPGDDVSVLLDNSSGELIIRTDPDIEQDDDE